MSQRFLSLALKAVDALASLACVFVAMAVMPEVEGRGALPAGSTIAFALGCVPLLALACVAWSLFSAIGRGEVFTTGNAGRLRTMGCAAVVDAAIWLVELVLYVVAVPVTIFSVTASLSVALVFAVSLAVVSLALALLTERATVIKDENDLVI